MEWWHTDHQFEGPLRDNWEPQGSVENIHPASQEEEFTYREEGAVDDFRCGNKMKQIRVRMIPPAAGFSLKRKERRREFKDSIQETAAERLDWRTYSNAEE